MNFQSSGSRSRFQPVFFTVGKFENKNKKLKFYQKEDFTSYLPFSISYSPTVHTVQNSQAFNYKSSFFIYLFFHFLLDPDPGKNSGSMWIRIRIHNTACLDPGVGSRRARFWRWYSSLIMNQPSKGETLGSILP